MKIPVPLIIIIFFGMLCFIAGQSQQPVTPTPTAVVKVATALNHLTVLEFHEPVTLAAAGSADFQIEREANTGCVQPVKSGGPTDLFVWSSARRVAYELEITQEVMNMNFDIDSAPPAPATPAAHAEAEADDPRPAETTQGVVSIGQGLKSPAVVQLVFGDGVKATVVL